MDRFARADRRTVCAKAAHDPGALAVTAAATVRADAIYLGRDDYDRLCQDWPDLPYYTQEIGCGQCINCRVDRSRQWSIRNACELQTSSDACMLTLTYNDDMLPVAHCYDELTGQIDEYPVLRKDHLSGFVKRFRDRYGAGIRFFASGEYGEQSFRPHYHILLYNIPPDFRRTWIYHHRDPGSGYAHYVSDAIDELWTERIVDPDTGELSPVKVRRTCGIHDIVEVDGQCIAYVSGYVTKKIHGPLPEPDDLPPGVQVMPRAFALMSRRPGIGAAYAVQHEQSIRDLDSITVRIGDRVEQLRPPAYYDRLFDIPYSGGSGRASFALRRLQAARSMVDEIRRGQLDDTQGRDVRAEIAARRYQRRRRKESL